jgi:hypothetical protein
MTNATPDRDSLALRAVRQAEATEGVGPAYYAMVEIDDHIDEAVIEAERSLEPAGRQAAGDGVIFCAKMLSAQRPANDVLSGYAAILGELPADLLAKALRGAVASTTWHKLPPPGVFMNIVVNEVSERRTRLSTLKRHRDRIKLVSLTRSHRAPQLEAVTFRPPPIRLRRIGEELDGEEDA